MNRKVLAVLAAVLLTAAACAACFADSSWKLAGAWNYTLSIPSAAINGYPASLTETGVMTMHMTESGDKEYFSTYDQNWNGTLTVNGQGQTYSGSVAGKTLNPALYNPGSAYVSGNTQTISGTTVKSKYTLTQVEENKVTGTAVLTYGGETATGTITATRPSQDGGDSGGGGCSAGFAAIALLALVPLVLRRKQDRQAQ